MAAAATTPVYLSSKARLSVFRLYQLRNIGWHSAARRNVVEPSLQVLFSSASNFDLSSHSDLAMAITSETTMLKQAALALCLTLPVTRGVSADPDIVDVSTWRWKVNSILGAQQDAEINPPSKAASLRAIFFDQQYERYRADGVRDAASKGSGR